MQNTIFTTMCTMYSLPAFVHTSSVQIVFSAVYLLLESNFEVLVGGKREQILGQGR